MVSAKEIKKLLILRVEIGFSDVSVICCSNGVGEVISYTQYVVNFIQFYKITFSCSLLPQVLS